MNKSVHNRRRQGLRVSSLALLAALLSPVGQASWLDSDFYCRVYGCVVVHDGFSFDVYDVYVFSTGGQVQPGQPLIPWSGNPFEGSGSVNPVITGTRTESFYAAPVRDEGVMLEITRSTNGNGGGNGNGDSGGNGNNARYTILDDGDGVLDAGDSLDPFEIDDRLSVRALESSAQRSFYLSSRTAFEIFAISRITGAQTGINQTPSLNSVAFDYGITGSGTDDGMRFGRDADRSGWRKLGAIDDLGDLVGTPVPIAEFTRDIRRRNSATIADQSVRFDYVYGFQNYDLSLGAGALTYELEFTFVRR